MIASRSAISADAVALHYDELDQFYRDVWGEHVHHGLWLRGDETREQAVRQLVQTVAGEAQISQGSHVCDIGCGCGATARMLAREYGAEVTAITVSPAQHAFAERQSPDDQNLNYVLGDWLSTELASGPFDSAIAIESSEHMSDKGAFFSRAYRVLRPKGRLVVCAWLSCEAPSRRAERWLLEPICCEGRMPHMGTESDYRDLAASAGFAVDRVQDVSDQVAQTWPMIVRLFVGKLLRKPAYVRFLLSSQARNRVFALTIFRIWLAYRTSAMRYAIFTLVK